MTSSRTTDIGRASSSPARTPAHGRRSARRWYLTPENPTHLVHPFPLASPEALAGGKLAAELRHAAALADIIRRYQEMADFRPNDAPPDLAALREQLAVCLERAGSGVTCSASKRGLALRAGALRGDDAVSARREAASLDERQLIACAGALNTWSRKSTEPYFSAFFGWRDTRFDDALGRLDAMTAGLTDYLRRMVNPELEMAPPLPLQVCQLMLCAGEANRLPKHFAYFLPEEEGIADAAAKKTVLFHNVHRQLLLRVAEPFARQTVFMDGAPWSPDPDTAESHALFHFRGHDIGHGVSLPGYRPAAVNACGRWIGMGLEETLADIFGLLLIAGGPWAASGSLSTEAAVSVFTIEMLRYARRGIGLFADSDAALLELNFLASNGYIHLDEQRRRISTSTRQISDGARELARILTATVLSNDESGVERLVARYSPGGDSRFARRFLRCFGYSHDDLDYIQEEPCR